MTDTKLLDGNVEDVKAGLAGLDAAILAALLAAEQAGKNRKSVIDAIELAQTKTSVDYTSTTDRGNGDDATTTTDVRAPSVAITTASSLDTSPLANIAPATEFEPSGAPVQSSGFDLDHVSLDANPRANTTEDQNRIDFNDPIRTGQEIVTERLKAAAAD